MDDIKLDSWKNELARIKYTLKTTESYPLTLHNGLQLEHQMVHPFPVRCITYASAKTGQQFISHLGSGSNTQINIWTIANAGFTKKFQRIKIQSITINHLTYVAKHRVFVGFCQDLYLRVFSSVFDELSRALCPTTVLSVFYNEPTDEIFTCGVGFISIWKFGNKINDPLEPGRNIPTTVTPDKWVTGFEVYPNAEKLLAISGDGIFVLDYYHNEQVNFFKNWHDLSLTCCAVYRPLEYIITGAKDGPIKVWNLMVYSLIHTFHGHLQSVTGLIVHPHEPLLLSSSTDHTLRTWRLDTFEETCRINVGDAILGMKLLNNHQLFYHSKDTIKVWNLNHFYSVFAVIHSHVIRMSCVTSPNRSSRIMVFAEDGGVRLLSPTTSNIITTLFPLVNNEVIEDVTYDLRFNYLFAVLKDGDVLVFDAQTNPCTAIQLWQHETNDDKVTTVAVMQTDDAIEVEYLEDNKVPSLSLLFAGLYNGEISLLHGSNTRMENIAAHGGAIIRLTVSERNINSTGIGRYCRLVSLGNDRIVRIWRVNVIHPETIYLSGLRSVTLDGVPTNVCMMDNALCVSMRDYSTVICQLHETKGGEYIHQLSSPDHTKDNASDADNKLKNRALSLNTSKSVGLEAPSSENRSITAMTTRTFETIEEVESSDGLLNLSRERHATVLTQASSHWSYTDAYTNKANNISIFSHHQDEEHTQEVIDISCCSALQLFVTSARDGSVKVWDTENGLVREMVFDDSIRGVTFMNKRGDILIGFQKHISMIPVHNYLPPQYLEKLIEMDFEDEPIEEPAPFNTEAQFWYKKDSIPTLPVPLEWRLQDHPNYDLRAIRIANMSMNKTEAFHPTLLSRLYYGLSNTEFISKDDIERGEKAIRIFLKQGVLIKKRLKDKLHSLARRARARTSVLKEESEPAQVTDLISKKSEGNSRKTSLTNASNDLVTGNNVDDSDILSQNIYKDEMEESEVKKLDAMVDGMITEIASVVFDDNFSLLYHDGYVPNSVARKLLEDFMPDLHSVVVLPPAQKKKDPSMEFEVLPEENDEEDRVFIWSDSNSEKESKETDTSKEKLVDNRTRTYTFDFSGKRIKRPFKKKRKEESKDSNAAQETVAKSKPRKGVRIRFQKQPLPPPTEKKSVKVAKDNLADLVYEGDRSLEDVLKRLAKLGFMPRGISQTKDSILKVFLMMIDHCTTVVHQEICAGIISINKFNGLDENDIDTVVKKLIEQLNHPLPQVRLNATQALSTMGIKNKSIMVAMLPRLVDSQASIRDEAKVLLEISSFITNREDLIKLMEELGALKTVEQVDEAELIADIADRQVKGEDMENTDRMSAWLADVPSEEKDVIDDFLEGAEVPAEEENAVSQEELGLSEEKSDTMVPSTTEKDVIHTNDEVSDNMEEKGEQEIDFDEQEADDNKVSDHLDENEAEDAASAGTKSMWKSRKQKIIGATRMRYNLLIHRSKTKLEKNNDEKDNEKVANQSDITFKKLKKLNRNAGGGLSDHSTDGSRSKQASDHRGDSIKSSNTDENDKMDDKSHYRRHRHRHKKRGNTVRIDTEDLGQGDEASSQTANQDLSTKAKQRRNRERVRRHRNRKQEIEVISTNEMANIIPKANGIDSEFSSDDLKDDDFKDSQSSDDGVYVRVDSGKRKQKSKKHPDVYLPSIAKARSNTYHPIYRSSSRVDVEDRDKFLKSRDKQVLTSGNEEQTPTLPSLTADDRARQSDASSIRRSRSSRASSKDYNSMSDTQPHPLDQRIKQPLKKLDSDGSHDESKLKDQTIKGDITLPEVDSSSDHSSAIHKSQKGSKLTSDKNESPDRKSQVSRALELLKSIDEDIVQIRQQLKEERDEIKSASRSSPRHSRKKHVQDKKTDSILSSFNAGLAFIKSLNAKTGDHRGREVYSAPTTEKEEKSIILRKSDKFRVDYTKLYANKFIHDDRAKLTTAVSDASSGIRLKMTKGSKGQRLTKMVVVDAMNDSNNSKSYDHLKNLKEDEKYFIEPLPHKLGIHTPIRSKGNIRFGIMNMIWTTEAPELKLQTDTRIQLDENAERLIPFDEDDNEIKARNEIATKRHHYDALLQQMRFPSSLEVINRSISAPVTELDHKKAQGDGKETVELINQLLQSTNYLLIQPPNDYLAKANFKSDYHNKSDNQASVQNNPSNNHRHQIPAHDVHTQPIPQSKMEVNDEDGDTKLKNSTLLYLANHQADIKNSEGHKLSNLNILPSIAS
ncbi:WD repeat-containing protein 87 [Trichoplax sp. H2]|nr:WD repeat-containing protein 87 [Trichoplax sp. H2]|eukprot:RDD40671.1 WD repeat-containing protein 87 [Trichoplax sp. H2]